MAKTGEGHSIKKAGGKAEIKQHLENLGFVVVTPVTVITEIGGGRIYLRYCFSHGAGLPSAPPAPRREANRGTAVLMEKDYPACTGSHAITRLFI